MVVTNVSVGITSDAVAYICIHNWASVDTLWFIYEYVSLNH